MRETCEKWKACFYKALKGSDQYFPVSRIAPRTLFPTGVSHWSKCGLLIPIPKLPHYTAAPVLYVQLLVINTKCHKMLCVYIRVWFVNRTHIADKTALWAPLINILHLWRWWNREGSKITLTYERPLHLVHFLSFGNEVSIKVV